LDYQWDRILDGGDIINDIVEEFFIEADVDYARRW
jgi:hypothetical protein